MAAPPPQISRASKPVLGPPASGKAPSAGSYLTDASGGPAGAGAGGPPKISRASKPVIGPGSKPAGAGVL